MRTEQIDSGEKISLFYEGLSKLLGPESLVSGPEQLAAYKSNVSGFERDTPFAVRPKNKEQVIKIVELANRYTLALYPISQGKNWGLGSKLPVRDACVIVDLSLMNRIVEVNREFGYAQIEPGVTQGQLADYLQQNNIPFFLDVTGAGRETSIVGNTLERGVAYNSLRVEKLISLEIVLGKGEVLQTGYGHYQNSQVTPLFRHGIGPALDGIFVQSNFGIVTSAIVELLPVPECQTAFVASLKDEDQIGKLVERLRLLKQQRILDSVVHIANKRRSEITLAPLVYEFFQKDKNGADRQASSDLVQRELKGSWSAIGSLMGTRVQVAESKRRVKEALAPFGKVNFIDVAKVKTAKRIAQLFGLKKKQAFIAAIEPLMGMTRGVPTDAALHSIYWPNAKQCEHWTEPDLGQSGILFCAPIIPMNDSAVTRSVATIEKLVAKLGFVPAITLNMLHDKALEGVISIDFNRADTEQREKAHQCIRELNSAFMDMGFFPYRIDINNMPMVVDMEDTFWRVVGELKQVFDPNGIIAPQRYNAV